MNDNRAAKQTMRALAWIAKYGFLLILIAITLIPFLWALSTSFKPPADILVPVPKVVPERWTLANYAKVLSSQGYGKYMLNSITVSLCSVGLTVITSLFAGYAASRYNFRGKNLIMFLILAGMAIGRFTNAMPLYFFSVKTGLFDTFWMLTLAYAAFNTPLVTWLMQSYFNTIPKTLEEAALLDGCSRWKAFWRIVVPIMRPSILAGAIIALTYSWNEFILALVLTKEMRTIPVSLYMYITDMGVDWGSLTAASFLSMIPVLIVFFALQKYFLQGLTAGSLAGT